MATIENLTRLARLFNAKGIVMKEVTNPKRNNGVFDKEKFNKKVKTEEFYIDSTKIITAYDDKSTSAHLIFLHGGSYICEGLIFHRKIIEKMVRKYHYKVTYIDYPLAPEHTALYTHDVVMRAYKSITKKYKDSEFCLFGDSAGGGLALAFLQTLVKKRYKTPSHTILVSPWLDISMSNPQTFIYEEKDPTLSVASLLYAGRRYAGRLTMEDPLVSPSFGTYDGLNKVLVFVGTHEIFYPDCVDFVEKCKLATGTEAELEIFPDMFHDFVMTPIKQSGEALDKMQSFLTR